MEELPMTAVAVSAPTALARPAVRRTGPSLPAFVVLEIRKSLSTRSGKALAAASALLGPVAMAIGAGSAVPGEHPVSGPLAITGTLTGFILISLGVLSTAGEWTHRTVQTTFLLVPFRGRVLAAKAVAVALVGAALAAVSAGLSAAMVVAITDDVVWTEFGRALITAVAAGAVFAVVGAGVGAALGNTPAALTGLYMVLLGLMPVLETLKPVIAHKIDPANAVLNLGQGQSQTQSVVILAAWVVVPAVAGWVLTHRRAVQ
jgi:hypothetical protein